jgi:hypothetical protein
MPGRLIIFIVITVLQGHGCLTRPIPKKVMEAEKLLA